MVHGQPACPTTQPRLPNLLMISPSMSASILSTFKSQCLRQYADRVTTSRACHEIAREPPPMSLIRLLQRKPDGEIVFREPTSGDVPAYAILSHTWGKEEVIFQDMEAGADMTRL